jgi:hypothetical protein
MTTIYTQDRNAVELRQGRTGELDERHGVHDVLRMCLAVGEDLNPPVPQDLEQNPACRV